MTAPVAAQSLSSLTTLFANPPRYPRNPAHAAHEPIVLYIVRVPGGRDVFLTPLRPPTKTTVSLESIQSCLYYLHVVTPEDVVLRRSLEEENHGDGAISRTPSIHRKPLPTTPFANYPPSERPPIPPKSYPYYQPTLDGDGSDTQTARYIARGQHLRLNSSESGSALNRTPMGPRVFNATQKDLDSGNVKRKPVGGSPEENGICKFDSMATIASQADPSLPREENMPFTVTTQSDRMNTINGPPAGSGEDNMGHARNETLGHGNDGDSRLEITLIRRDPSSGAQWNVGVISFPVPGNKAADDFVQRSVNIELSSPGYQKFAKQADSVDLDANVFNRADEIKNLLASDIANSSASVASDTPTHHAFVRQVQPQVRHEHGNGSHRRGASDHVLASLRNNVNNNNKSKLRPRFAFQSPWQGSCTFNTGMDGKSLKCQHTLSSTSSSEESLGVDVAELRFNLPWLTSRITQNGSREPGGVGWRMPAGQASRESFKRGMQRLKHKSWSAENSTLDAPSAQRPQPGPASRSWAADSDSESDGEDRMDLTLGREKAGGGFKGKSAKLGKLIIADEGLKMCDLVVGACMGIWWQQYRARIEDS